MRHYLRFVAPLAALVTGLYAGGVGLLLNAGFAPAQEGALLAATGFVAANAFYLMGLGLVRGMGNAAWAQLFDGLFTVPLALALGLMLLTGGCIETVGSVLAATACLVALMALLFALVWRQTRDWGSAPVADAPSPWVDGSPMMMISFLMFFGQWLPQFLAGTLFRLEALTRRIREGQDPTDEINDLKAALRREQGELRVMIQRLRRGEEGDRRTDLVEELETLLGEMSQHWRIAVRLESEVRPMPVSIGLAHELRQ
jgi:hypothetical protein